MKAPRVSVVLPSYNVARFIGGALDSVFAQTYTDYEVIVVNDGSPDTDELERALEPYRSRITYIKQENRGLAGACNTAVRAAQGEWIAQLDPDDLWEPEYLQTQIRFIDSHPQAAVVYADAVIFGDSPEAGRTFMNVVPSRGEVTLERLVTQECAVIHPATLVRRTAILEAGMFDDSLRTSEDFDLWLRIVARGGRILYHTAVLARYRRHAGSLTADPAWTTAHALHVLEKNRRALSLSTAQRQVFDRQIAERRAYLRLLEARRALAASDWTAARQAFDEASRARPSLKLTAALFGLRIAPRLLRLLLGHSPAGESLTRRASWILFARVFSFAISIALPLLLVRRLDQLSFGLYKQVFLVVNTVINLMPLGFGMSAWYFMPREPAHRREIVLNIVLFLAFVGAAGCLVVTAFPGLLVFISKEPAIASYAPRIGLVIWLWILSAFLDVAVIASQEMQLATVAILVSQISRTAFFLLAAILFGTVESLIAAAICQGVLQALLLFGYLSLRFPRFWTRFDARVFRAQLSYALPLGLAGLIYVLHSDLHSYFVSARFGASTFALYAVGCIQLPLAALLGEAAGSVLIPRIAELQKRNETQEIIALTLRATRKLSAVLLPAYAYLLVTAREFISFLFTAQYLASWPVFVVNLTLMPVSVLPIDPIMRACAQYRYRLLQLRVATFVILALGLWWATGRWGPIGAISAAVAVIVGERLALILAFGRVLGFGRAHLGLFRDTVMLALASGLAAVAAAVVRLLVVDSGPFFVLLASGLAFLAVYAGMVLLFGVPTREEMALGRGFVLSRLTSRSRC